MGISARFGQAHTEIQGLTESHLVSKRQDEKKKNTDQELKNI